MTYKKDKSLPQLERYKDIPNETFIKDWTDAADPENYDRISDFYMSPPWLWPREMIHWRGLENDPRVIKADIEVLKLVLKKKNMSMPDWAQLDFEDTAPLEFWWYYLYLIQDGNYPLELLPDHLKDIYREHLKNLGKL